MAPVAQTSCLPANGALRLRGLKILLASETQRDYFESIGGWYGDPDLRLQGVGRALVEAAENWTRRLGRREMASDCELHNETSFKAHLAIGYDETGRSIHFRKSLSASNKP